MRIANRENASERGNRNLSSIKQRSDTVYISHESMYLMVTSYMNHEERKTLSDKDPDVGCVFQASEWPGAT